MSLPKKAKSYTQKFRAEWQKETDFKAWLVPVDGDNSLARCRLCSKNFGAKRYNLQQHKDTAYHKKLENNLPSVPSAHCMNRFISGTENAKIQKRKVLELQLSSYIANHTSFSASPHLANIVGKNSTDASPKLGRTKVSMVIKNVLAPAYREDLIKAVRGKPFSLILDEATDCRFVPQAGIQNSFS